MDRPGWLDSPDWLVGIPRPWFEEIKRAYLAGHQTGSYGSTVPFSAKECFELFVENSALLQVERQKEKINNG